MTLNDQGYDLECKQMIYVCRFNCYLLLLSIISAVTQLIDAYLFMRFINFKRIFAIFWSILFRVVNLILEIPLRRLSIEKMSKAMGMLMTSESLRTVPTHFNVNHNAIRSYSSIYPESRKGSMPLKSNLRFRSSKQCPLLTITHKRRFEWHNKIKIQIF